MIHFNRPAMTWADIMADRVARGLERAPKTPKAKVAKVEAPPQVNGVDRRHVDNDTPCTVPTYKGPAPKSAAGAAKVRRESMRGCGCRLCALALRPVATFAEMRALGMVDLASEQEVELFGGPRKASTHAPSRETVKAAEAARAAELAKWGPEGVCGAR
ncbi:MAG: hypothetical protein SFW67_28450 [Myxococcaceae bacterium]|nr:hypothetical protein [Myxococcaceae bacterium]